MENSTYLQISKVIEDEKKQGKVRKINLLLAVALICVSSLLLGALALAIDLLSNHIIEYPICYIVVLVVIIVVLVSFCVYALPNNDFSAKEAEVLERGRLRRYELSLFKALSREDYDSLKDFKITSKEQLLETIDELTEMDREYLEQFSPYATIVPAVEPPPAVVLKNSRSDISVRSKTGKRPLVHISLG
jgi:hypothetical protein